MKLSLLYFARLRETLGVESEQLDSEAANVAELLAELRQRGQVWTLELAADKVFRVAVNQEMAGLDTPLADGDEVAVFPPVTGG
ncbi:molybdopterin converting factor subunit 1 [Chromobacterium violaceum]|uniref:Molybdopterin synthase sulfur carrier subunit n=2 Tax=Chromobacterium violaceum TaxID=536 RepID=A0A1R0MN38_CHRVL|nr:molybdopterin converting factor subunit 1 [Chromobacterium violaceum]AAQ57865.1 molybdopterin-converting factor subunit 1 [Chromobacterium violaceum ATCC 12472]ATP27068.1 molybdopterin converting factor subunit 1 [Chromobacterium violaceum]ATP30981.1 molybdopterin converting factor subunit 1 [Chromobacterium violaceum]KMN49611.1 molybdenum cofactor biosynthesis protein MoaD [Chromobacterium violaceum]KMN84963.1 molybdenum cofactor biosynthesis protein MoaD [Chromobacterium violaceum]